MKKIFKSVVCQVLIMSFLSLPVEASMYEDGAIEGADYSLKKPAIEVRIVNSNSWGIDDTRKVAVGSDFAPGAGSVIIGNGEADSKMYSLKVVHQVGCGENTGTVVPKEQVDEDFCALGIDCGTEKSKVVFAERAQLSRSDSTYRLLEHSIDKYMKSSLSVTSEDDVFMLNNNSFPRIGWDNTITSAAFTDNSSYFIEGAPDMPFEISMVNKGVLSSPDRDPLLLKRAQHGFYTVWDKVSSMNFHGNEKYYKQQELGYLVWAERLFRAYSSHNDTIFDKLKASPNACIVVSTSSTTSPTNRRRLVAALKYVFEYVHGINSLGSGLKYYVLDGVEAAAMSYLYEGSYKSNPIIFNIGHSELSISGVNPYERKVYDAEAWYGLGGATVDRIICSYFEKKIQEELGISLSTRMRMHILKSVVDVKHKLSADGASSVRLQIDLGEDDFEYDLSIEEFNKLLIDSGYISKIKESVRDYAIRFIENNSACSEITAVFAGGGIRSPLIKKSIMEALEDIDVVASAQHTLNFDECSAYGGCYAISLKDLPSFVDDYTDKAFDLDADAVKAFDTLLLNYNNKVLLSKVKNDLESFLYGIQKEEKAKSTVAYSGKTIFDLTCEILEALKGKNISLLIDKLDEVQQQIQRNNMNDSSVMEFRSNVLGFWARLR